MEEKEKGEVINETAVTNEAEVVRSETVTQSNDQIMDEEEQSTTILTADMMGFAPFGDGNVQNANGTQPGNGYNQSYNGTQVGQNYNGTQVYQNYNGTQAGQNYNGMQTGQNYNGMQAGQNYNGMQADQNYNGTKPYQNYNGMQAGQNYNGMQADQNYNGMQAGADYNQYQSYNGMQNNSNYDGSQFDPQAGYYLQEQAPVAAPTQRQPMDPERKAKIAKVFGVASMIAAITVVVATVLVLLFSVILPGGRKFKGASEKGYSDINTVTDASDKASDDEADPDDSKKDADDKGKGEKED